MTVSLLITYPVRACAAGVTLLLCQNDESFDVEHIFDSQLKLAKRELDNLLSRIDESEFDPTFSGLFPVSALSDCARVLQPSTSNHLSRPCSSRFVLKSDEQLEEAKALLLLLTIISCLAQSHNFISLLIFYC